MYPCISNLYIWPYRNNNTTKEQNRNIPPCNIFMKYLFIFLFIISYIFFSLNMYMKCWWIFFFHSMKYFPIIPVYFFMIILSFQKGTYGKGVRFKSWMCEAHSVVALYSTVLKNNVKNMSPKMHKVKEEK